MLLTNKYTGIKSIIYNCADFIYKGTTEKDAFDTDDTSSVLLKDFYTVISMILL